MLGCDIEVRYNGAMHVAQIWRYPVKSMVGGEVDVVDIGPQGIVGDRVWAVRDQVRGGIRGAKVLGGLMRLSAQFADGPSGPVVIGLPDGTTVRTDDPTASVAVSRAMRHIVRDLGQNVGIYADVSAGGTVRVGDHVTIV